MQRERRVPQSARRRRSAKNSRSTRKPFQQVRPHSVGSGGRFAKPKHASDVVIRDLGRCEQVLIASILAMLKRCFRRPYIPATVSAGTRDLSLGPVTTSPLQQVVHICGYACGL